MRDRKRLNETPRSAVVMKVKDLTEYDVLWSGYVITGVDVCGDPEYRELRMRRNGPDGVGVLDTRTYHEDVLLAVLD